MNELKISYRWQKANITDIEKCERERLQMLKLNGSKKFIIAQEFARVEFQGFHIWATLHK